MRTESLPFVSLGHALRLALAFGSCLLWVAIGAAPAQAQAAGAPAAGAPDASPNLQLRLYVNAHTSGSVTKSPQDPTGSLSGATVSNDGAALELIFFGHIGLSASQAQESRRVQAAGTDTRESWTDSAYGLTLYLREAGHDRVNLFIGANLGTTERYTATVNGVPSAVNAQVNDMPLSQSFAGLEYAFRRVGFRAAYLDSSASRTVAGQKVLLTQTLTVVSVFIPFN